MKHRPPAWYNPSPRFGLRNPYFRQDGYYQNPDIGLIGTSTLLDSPLVECEWTCALAGEPIKLTSADVVALREIAVASASHPPQTWGHDGT